MTDNEFDYSSDIGINGDELDLEWLRQSSTFMKYSHELAHQEKVVKKAHEKLKTIRSELVMNVHSDPGLAGVSKVTAPIIEAYYRTHDDYVAAKKAWVDAEYEKDLLQGAVSALHQKRAALESLTRLHSQEYFAGPSVPQDINRERVEKAKETRSERVRDQGSRRRRSRTK